jgi:hypothetical protein
MLRPKAQVAAYFQGQRRAHQIIKVRLRRSPTVEHPISKVVCRLEKREHKIEIGGREFCRALRLKFLEPLMPSMKPFELTYPSFNAKAADTMSCRQ